MGGSEHGAAFRLYAKEQLLTKSVVTLTPALTAYKNKSCSIPYRRNAAPCLEISYLTLVNFIPYEYPCSIHTRTASAKLKPALSIYSRATQCHLSHSIMNPLRLGEYNIRPKARQVINDSPEVEVSYTNVYSMATVHPIIHVY